MENVYLTDSLRLMMHQELIPAYEVTDYLSLAAASKTTFPGTMSARAACGRIGNAAVQDESHGDCDTAGDTKSNNDQVVAAIRDLDLNDGTCSVLTENGREELAHWVFRVIDHKHLERKTACHAIKLFDLVLSHHPGMVHSPQQTQLLIGTCLLVAVKLAHDGHTACRHRADWVTMDDLCLMSRRQRLRKEDFQAMECAVLETLDWFLHPPLAEDFLLAYIYALPYSFDHAKSKDIWDVATCAIDNIVLQYSLVMARPSHVALAALKFAIDEVQPAQQHEPAAWCAETSWEDPLSALQFRASLHFDFDELSHCHSQIKCLMQGTLRTSSPTSVTTHSL